ncbi:MAG: gliding motility-associated C-terminal domain-containing protein, partial [Mucilaginibacter sp.]
NVTITGGTLQFKGSGNGNGTVYSYVNADATATRGRRTFQIVRIPQYSNLKLSSNISAPPFNGRTGGIIAFNVAGGMDFNGYTIDATARGFRGGYSLVKEAVGNIKDLYVADASNPRVSGKGEGIAGTPRYMWDGYNEINNGVEGLPGGSGGRGAPANAGGGGNDTNAGGGGGGNGGAGGNGGGGYAPIGGELPSGGRPGMNMPIGVARLVMGGGGGGGHANDAVTGVKGGVGGGVVLITAGTITGTGQVLANGSDGSKGVSGPNPDGSGGGGAGGSVFINVLNNSSANLSVQAKGGKGGNTERDPGGGGVQPHGPGGGGGGGTVFYTPASGTVTANVAGGNSGLSNAGEGIPNLATNGLAGSASAVAASALPDYLTSNGTCYPELVTTMIVSEPTVAKPAGSTVTYTITTTNRAAESSAAGVRIECLFPQEITFVSAIATYTGNASGSPQITNQGTAVKPLFGDFNIPAGGVITLTIFAQTDCNASGTYNSSAQASYLDPTRTFATSTRRITAAAGAFANSNTTYETGVTGDVPGKNYNGAPGTETGEDVNVLPPPANVNTIVKTDTESAYCVSTNPAVIAGNTPVNGTISYQWQVASGGGGFVDITGAVSKDYNPPVINTSTAYRRVVTAQPCAKIVMSNEVHYNITALPPAPTVPPQTICANTAATFTVTTPQPGLTYNWYADAGRVNLLGSGTSFTTTPLVATTTFYAEAVSGTCTSVTLTNVQAIVTAPPAAPVVAGFAPVCAGTPITLNISAPQGGVLYKWYSASTGGNSIYTGTGFGLQPVATITYYAEANNGSCPSQRTPVTVTVLQAPSAPIVQGAFICPGSTATLTANAGQGVTVKWYDAVNSTAEIFTGNMFITPPLNASTTYYAETVNDNGGCTSVTRTAVNADIARRLDAPMVTVGETTIKSVTFNWTIVAGATGYEVSTDDGQTYNNIGNVRTYTISSLSANQSVTLMVRAVGTSSCETSVSGSVTGVSINPELDKIYIPNIFTPNGDGNNDVLYVRSLGIKTLVFYVYDQWGEMIFRSNNQASGWDGTYKGTVMPVGVYVYYVEAIMLDGQKQNKKGTITLLR